MSPRPAVATGPCRRRALSAVAVAALAVLATACTAADAALAPPPASPPNGTVASPRALPPPATAGPTPTTTPGTTTPTTATPTTATSTTTLLATTLPPTTLPATTTTATTAPPPTPSPYPAPPPRSGTGRRVVYANGAQRVWLVDAGGTVLRSYRVSGRRYVPKPATYKVFSRARYTAALADPSVRMEYMVRFTRSASGNTIGFHTIPTRGDRALQSERQLGLPLSSGCIRQARGDAIALWSFAWEGTPVVVVP